MSDSPSAGYSSSYASAARQEPDDAVLIQLQQISLNRRILTTINPWLGDRPDITMELAMSGTPPDVLASQTAGLAGIQATEGMRGTLEDLSPVAQRSIYNRLTAVQQRALNQSGYAVPDAPDSGFLHDVAGPVGKVLGPAFSPIATVGGPVLHKGLDVVTWIGDQPGHLYRTIRTMDGESQWIALGGAVAAVGLLAATGGLAGLAAAGVGTLTYAGAIGGSALLGATAAAAVTDPWEWYDSFNSSWDGESVFERGAQRQARRILQGDELLAMAKNVALSLDPYELASEAAGEGMGEAALNAAIERTAADLAEKGSPQYQAIFAGLLTLTAQEPFRRAVDILQRGKISFGRDVADSLGFSASSPWHTVTSGMLDGFWAFSMDPTLAAGHALQWNKVRRGGIGLAGGDDAIARLAKMLRPGGYIRKTADQAATAITAGDISLMPKAWRGMYTSAREWLQMRGGPREFKSIDEFAQHMLAVNGSDVFTDVADEGELRFLRDVINNPHLDATDELFDGHTQTEIDEIRDYWSNWKPNQIAKTRIRYAQAAIDSGEYPGMTNDASQIEDALHALRVRPTDEHYAQWAFALNMRASDLERLAIGWDRWEPGVRAGAERVFTGADWLEYFKTADGMDRLLRGQATVRGVEHAILQRQRESAGWTRFIREMRGMRNELDDYGLERVARQRAKAAGEELHLEAYYPSEVMGQSVELNMNPDSKVVDRLPGKIGEEAGRWFGMGGYNPVGLTVGRLLGHITSMASPNKAIILYGEGAEDSILRFVSQMGRASMMPAGMRDEWANAIINQGTLAQRLQAIHSFQDTAFSLAGLRSNVELQKLADLYLHKSHSAFALGGLERFSLAGIPTAYGILPESHQAVMMVLPDLREMTKAIRRGHLLKHVFKISDSNFVEATMSRFWKPAVLMRLGFIPRAAGEEMLAWAARMTTGGVGQEFGARSLAMRDAYEQAVKAAYEVEQDPTRILSVLESEALNWKLPTHVRPLANMLSRIGWKTPEQHFLENYGIHLRGFLEDGIGHEIPEVQIGRGLFGQKTTKQWFHPLLYGRDKSWRRMVVEGVDKNLQDAARSWVQGHGRAVMKATSALNASALEKSVVSPDIQFVYRTDPKNPGQFIEEPMITMMGERFRVGQSDWRYPAAIHHRINEIFDDEIIGPIVARHLLHYFPGFQGLDKPGVLAALDSVSTKLDRSTRKLMLDALQPRDDIWRASARGLSGVDPWTAKALEATMFDEDVAWPSLIDNMRKLAAHADTPPDAAVRLKQLADEMQTLQPLMDAIDGADASGKAWLSGVLSAQTTSKGEFFSLPGARDWVSGATEHSYKRPEHVLYRGVKDASTLEIRPDGSLVLRPQQNDDWGGQVISTSRIADQSLSYATSASSFNAGGEVGLGAMIEFDADYALGLHGRTWDELAADPITYSEAQYSDRIGPQLIGHGIDDNEVAFVMSRGMQMRDPKYTQMTQQLDMATEEWGKVQDDVDYAMSEFERFNEADWSGNPLAGQRWDGIMHAFADGDLSDPVTQQHMLKRFYDEEINDISEDLTMTYGVDPPDEPMVWGQEQKIGDELVIPAGKWAIQNSQQMEAISLAVNNGMQTRWPWLGNVKWRSDAGHSYEGVLQAVDTKLREIRDADLALGNAGFEVSDQMLDEMVAYLRTLSADELDVIGQAMRAPLTEYVYAKDPFSAPDPTLGYTGIGVAQATDASLRRGASALLSDRDRSAKIAEALKLRGEGGFHFEAPRWHPFTESREEFEAALRSDLAAQLARPEFAKHVRGSMFTQQTVDGTPVVDPLQGGVQRVFVPQTQGHFLRDAVAHATAQNPASQDELIDTVVATLLAQPGAYRVDPDYIRTLSEAQRHAAVRATVARYLEGGWADQTAWSTPLHGVGYDDARVTQWVSDLISGSMNDHAPRGHFYVDIPEGVKYNARTFQPGGSDKAADLGSAGNVWKLGDEHGEHISHMTGDGVVSKGGHLVAGKSYQAALNDWADVIVRKVMTEISSGTKETMHARQVDEGVTNLLNRRVGKELRPVTPGERLGDREDYFDAAGQPVDWANPELMEPRVVTGEGLLYPIFMPMIRDAFEAPAGYANRVSKKVGQSIGAFEEGMVVPDVDQWVDMRRSRISDVLNTKGELDLPNVAISEIKTIDNNRVWDRVVRWGFDEVIGPSIDALVRKPMSFHYFAEARIQNLAFRAGFLHAKLFDQDVPRVFERHMNFVENSVLDAKSLAAARHLGESVYGLPMARATDDEVMRWLGTLAPDNDAFVGEMGKVALRADMTGDRAARAAADHLMSIDTTPLRLYDRTNSATTAESFVEAYYSRIPEDVWRKGGQTAVNDFIDDHDLKLPKLTTRDEWQTMLAARNNFANVTTMLEDSARQRALENVVPFLDSHEQRTQFAVITRNLLPFWYAEENFLRRWAKTLSLDGTYGLATLRKAQLSYMGIASAGLIRTDVNGKDWFVYPGSGLLTEAITRLPFLPEALPVGVMFQSPTDSMMPGLNARFGTPSVSPWVSFPMEAATTLFPDALPLKRAIMGDLGSTTGQSGGVFAPLRQFVPTTVRRVWEAAFMNEDSSRRYAAAMMSAAAFMEAEGKGLPEGATPDQLDAYLDKLRNHARIIMWAQVMGGFVVPGAPSPIITGEDTSGLGSFSWLTGMGVDNPAELASLQYRTFVDNLGINEGTQAYLASYPEADLEDVVNPLAFAVSQTQSVSGAPLPATKVALQWYNDNAGWVNQMPDAGAWFLPDDDEADFDHYSYTQQLVSGLRQQQTPKDFLRALKYRQGASTYFDNRDKYEQAASTLGDDQVKKRRLDELWESWSQAWRSAHPIFDEELQTGEARARRERTIDQLRYAVGDPAAPVSPKSQAIGEMSRAFDSYKVALMMINEKRDAKSQAKAGRLKKLFLEWATAWTLRNPDMEQLWSAVYRPQAGDLGQTDEHA